MTNPHILAPKLITGMRMGRDEFLRTWEEMPELKNAELIEGTVYVASPVSAAHSNYDFVLHGWLVTYAAHTPGCEGGANGTWLMLESAPQPDTHLRIREEYGGQSGLAQGKFAGAPELAVEVCVTSTQVDFGSKLALYQRAGVREYITLELLTKRVHWRVLEEGSYRLLGHGSSGVIRSRVFPGLWLDVAALWSQDSRAVLECVHRGLASAEHAAFVERLRAARK